MAGCLLCVIAVTFYMQSEDGSSRHPHSSRISPSPDNTIIRAQDSETSKGNTHSPVSSLRSNEGNFSQIKEPSNIGKNNTLEALSTAADFRDHDIAEHDLIDNGYQWDDYRGDEVLDVDGLLDADDEHVYLPITLSGQDRQEVGDFIEADGQFDDYRGGETRDVGGFLDADDEHVYLPITLSGENRQEVGDFR